MMTAVTLYHNPRCSKSRAAADYLAQQNVETRIVDPSLDNEALLAAIAAHPALLERPIAVLGGKAAIGRPTENIAALLAGE